MHSNAHEMNAKPGGKQPLMHDSVQWKPQPTKNVSEHYQWIPKGLIEVLTEAGCYKRTMKLEDMQEIATVTHTILKRFINNHGHAFLFIPKYHCELKFIMYLSDTSLHAVLLTLFSPDGG